MDPATGLCRGCYRTLDEIARWGEMTDSMRTQVIAELAARREAAMLESGATEKRDAHDTDSSGSRDTP
jgi:predicted Fe-S protein YdhL (DUF1289 family)